MPSIHDRVVEPEFLDHSPAPTAQRSLRDLVRVNKWFGGHRSLLSVLRTLVKPLDSFTFLDVGAGSGDMGARIRAHYPNAVVISLDYRLLHLSSAQGARVVADADSLPFCDASVDFVFCSQFLHHFDESRATSLVAEMRRLARRGVIILDLERHLVPYAFLPLTRGLFRWCDLTVHDGRKSVAAGFKTNELERIARRAGALEPKARKHWPWFRLTLVIRP